MYDTNHLGQPIGYPVTDWVPRAVPSVEPMSGQYCRLEPLKAELHGEPLFQANALDEEGRMWTYLPYGPFENYESYVDWMQRTCSGSDPLFFAIIDATTNKAAGVASYLRIEPNHGSIEVGHLAFSPLLQRTRPATEAMYLMMRRAFEQGYRRYEWKCNALNEPSRRAAQRLGFSFEGVFRQSLIIKGRNRDTAWYAAIDQEWGALKEAFETWLAPSNFDERGRQRISLSTLTQPILKQRG